MLTMTIATKTLGAGAMVARQIATGAGIAVAAIARAIVNRREVMHLAEFDDRALKDIGLVRSEVEGALATSWLDDPSLVLAARSSARTGVAQARRDAGLRRTVVSETPSRSVQSRALPAQAVSCGA